MGVSIQPMSYFALNLLVADDMRSKMLSYRIVRERYIADCLN